MYQKNLRAIEGVLHSMGLFGSRVSIRQMAYAVAISHENIRILTNVSKGLYAVVAEELGDTNSIAVERNLRALRDRVWRRGGPALLQKISGSPVALKPTTGEFVDMIRYHMEANDLFPDE